MVRIIVTRFLFYYIMYRSEIPTILKRTLTSQMYSKKVPICHKRCHSKGHFYGPFLKNRPSSASFLFIFGLFKQAMQILQQINVKKCPSSIRCRDQNSQPSNYESPPLTTRPGLPPNKLHSFGPERRTGLPQPRFQSIHVFTNLSTKAKTKFTDIIQLKVQKLMTRANLWLVLQTFCNRTQSQV